MKAVLALGKTMCFFFLLLKYLKEKKCLNNIYNDVLKLRHWITLGHTKSKRSWAGPSSLISVWECYNLSTPTN